MLVINQKKVILSEKSELPPLSPTVVNHNPYIKAATSQNTRKAYQQDIRHFISWGGVLPTTTETVTEYLSHHANLLNPRTLNRRLVGISQWHITQSYPDPTKSPLVKKTLKGIKNVHGKPAKKAPALLIDKLATIVEKLNRGNNLIDIRDNALIQLNFFGALRRSELAAINYKDIIFHKNEGMKIQINRSKTDQEGEGRTISIPLINTKDSTISALCPVTALEKWLAVSKIESGPLFRAIDKGGKISEKPLKGYSINCIIKKITNNYLGETTSYSSHSLRSGFATSASRLNIPLSEIMEQARWVSANTAIGYCQAGKSFQENAAFKLLETTKSKS
jgi:integrase